MSLLLPAVVRYAFTFDFYYTRLEPGKVAHFHEIGTGFHKPPQSLILWLSGGVWTICNGCSSACINHRGQQDALIQALFGREMIHVKRARVQALHIGRTMTALHRQLISKGGNMVSPSGVANGLLRRTPPALSATLCRS